MYFRHDLAGRTLGQRQAVTKLYLKLNGCFRSCFGLAMTNPKLLTDGYVVICILLLYTHTHRQ